MVIEGLERVLLTQVEPLHSTHAFAGRRMTFPHRLMRLGKGSMSFLESESEENLVSEPVRIAHRFDSDAQTLMKVS